MKYLTKGELLLSLGSSANSFTAFMLDPAAFGVAEPNLTMLKVAKQKLDWAASINIELPEVQELINTLEHLGIVDKKDADNVRNTPDRKEFDEYLVTVRAQDEITTENIYGVVFDGNAWALRVEFRNITKNEVYDIYESFDVSPDMDMVQEYVNNKIKELKGL